MRKLAVLGMALIVAASLFASGALAAETFEEVTSTLGENAEVLFFEDYGDGQLFAYTDDTTYIQEIGGAQRSVVAEYAGQYAFLRGNAVTVACDLEDIILVQRFDADTLVETDLTALDVSMQNVRALEADGFGRMYAVLESDTSAVTVFDATGGRATTLYYDEEIFGLQVLDNILYVFCNEQADAIPLDSALPELGGEIFHYTAPARPLRMLDGDLYTGMQGDVYRASTGEQLFETGTVPISPLLIRLAGENLLWTDDRERILCCDLNDSVLYFHPISGAAEAITASAAIVRVNGCFGVMQFGTFEPVPTPTPTPTAEPTQSPKPTATAKPIPTAKPTPTASAEPTPIPPIDALPLPEGMVLEGSLLYTPEGTTTARLKAIFAPYDVATYTPQMAPVSSKLRTGRFAVIDGTTYTVIVRGDLNASGTVNTTDLQLLQRVLAGTSTLDESAIRAADLNGDGVLNASDVVVLSGMMA